MSQKDNMLKGELYNATEEALFREYKEAKELIYQLNGLCQNDEVKKQELAQRLFGKIGKRHSIGLPFRCDYGSNIEIGDDFYSNYNCTILDCARVTIGDRVLFGPNVSLYTAGHPIDKDLRNSQLEYAFPITIGDDVWIGGNVVILPGVTIGSDVVIGAGSVVTKDIPSHHIACGNPCHVLREIGEEDSVYYFKKRRVDKQ